PGSISRRSRPLENAAKAPPRWRRRSSSTASTLPCSMSNRSISACFLSRYAAYPKTRTKNTAVNARLVIMSMRRSLLSGQLERLLPGQLDPPATRGFRNLEGAERVKETVTDAERFVDEHYVEVYRLALRLLHDQEGAIDLTQEVFYRALRALPRFRGDSTPRTWLSRITLNQARRPRPRAA